MTSYEALKTDNIHAAMQATRYTPRPVINLSIFADRDQKRQHDRATASEGTNFLPVKRGIVS